MYVTLTEAKEHTAALAPVMRSGRILAVDPASGGSSQPGVCVVVDGKLIMAGTLKLPKGSVAIHYRLNRLLTGLQEMQRTYGPFDMMVVEDVAIAFGGAGKAGVGKNGGIVTRGTTILQWAVGVTTAAEPWPRVVKVLPTSWHSWHRRKGIDNDAYMKTDANDALCIMLCAYEALTGEMPTGVDLRMLRQGGD